MKQNSRQLIEAAVAKLSTLKTEIAGIPGQASANETKLTQLVDTGDLADVLVVGEIMRCQALSTLLARRLQLRTEQIDGAEVGILDACREAIGGDLGSRARRAAQMARDSAHKTLAPHFSEAAQLNYAAEKSTLVQEANALVRVMTMVGVVGVGVPQYAAQVIKGIADLADFEARLK
jgi:hypothetical protein